MWGVTVTDALHGSMPGCVRLEPALGRGPAGHEQVNAGYCVSESFRLDLLSDREGCR